MIDHKLIKDENGRERDELFVFYTDSPKLNGFKIGVSKESKSIVVDKDDELYYFYLENEDLCYLIQWANQKLKFSLENDGLF